MFERYTEKARRVIFFARFEASQFGSPYIETEHLLLGLFREDKALIHRVAGSHASFESVRRDIEAHTPMREKVSTSIDLPLSNECKRILAHAAEEAEHLSDEFIATGHLLLGLLREQDSFAAQLLNQRGVSLVMVREQVAQSPRNQPSTSPRFPGLPAGYTSHNLLYNIRAETLIVELRSPGAKLLPARLFARHKDAETYEQVGSPDNDVSYESPVICDSHPIVVFNSVKHHQERKGEDWRGVYSFNLNTKEIALCISPENLRFSEPHGRMWILELVSLSEDARSVCVRIAIEKVVSGGGVIHHYLARVDFVNQEVKLLSRLMDVTA